MYQCVCMGTYVLPGVPISLAGQHRKRKVHVHFSNTMLTDELDQTQTHKTDFCTHKSTITTAMEGYIQKLETTCIHTHINNVKGLAETDATFNEANIYTQEGTTCCKMHTK